MKSIIGKYGWVLAIGCWLLAVGCSSDHTDEQRTGSRLLAIPYTSSYQSSDVLNRAPSVVTDNYVAYSFDHDFAISLLVWHAAATTSPTESLISYTNSTSTWNSQAWVDGGEPYTIFGYMPKQNTVTASVAKGEGTVALTLSGVNAVTADDICFVAGVKDNTDNNYLEGWQGHFDYEGKPESAAANIYNKVYLLMDHLYAAVNFQFTVDDEYSALRSIRLKSMTLSTPTATVTAVVTLTPNTTGADPVSSVGYTVTQAEEGTISAPFFESTTGILLNNYPTTADSIAAKATIGSSFCCFVPKTDVSNALTLVSTYDVYDSQGNKIRKDCTATNQLPHLSANRGQRVTFNLKVTPTYLYQLSEPDLDNPTIKVED